MISHATELTTWCPFRVRSYMVHLKERMICCRDPSTFNVDFLMSLEICWPLSFPAPVSRPLTARTAKQETLNSYTAVGIAEHWELSMALFDVRVKSPVRMWNPILVSNSGSKSERKQKVLEWAYLSPEIHSVIAADLLL